MQTAIRAHGLIADGLGSATEISQAYLEEIARQRDREGERERKKTEEDRRRWKSFCLMQEVRLLVVHPGSGAHRVREAVAVGGSWSS